MKGKFTFLKMSLVGLFLIAAVGVSAQVTPETTSVTFLCDGTSAQLSAPADYDNYAWYFSTEETTTPTEILGSEATQTVTQTGYYYVQVWNNDDGCKSPLSAGYPVYVLPQLTVNIAANDGDNAYCTDESTTGITLTATIGTPSPMPTGLGVSYQWYVADDNAGTNRVQVTGANSETLQVNESAAKSYFYDVVATYNVEVHGGADACEATSNVQEVIVSPLPEQPTITIVAAP